MADDTVQPSFWHDKWQQQQIGFHQQSINPYLIKFLPQLSLSAHAQIFVPLCGKSLDMHYLTEQGYQVLGCELDASAIDQYLQEQQLQYTHSSDSDFNYFDAPQIRLVQGDFFKLAPQQLSRLDGFYDRAALIAWPDEMRRQYAQKLAQLIPAGISGLLVTLDYPQAELAGPPFAVSDTWLQQHMAADFEIELLQSLDVLAENPRFVKKQVSWLNESVYMLTRK